MPIHMSQMPARRASTTSTASTLSLPESPPSSSQISTVENERENENERFSQSSQSSRIVSVPQNDAQEQNRLVIARIEHIFEAMVEVLTQGGDALSVPYRSRNTPQQPLGTLEFPGRTVNEATKFTRLVRIMELSRKALRNGRVITKRSIYYQDIELFKDQSVVDHLVDDLACTLGIGRNALNIVAASKGLVAGPLSLIIADGSALSYFSHHDDSSAIPSIGAIQQVDFATVRWVLVIEKEATFRTLAASQYWRDSVHGQGIIVTGKGYPDLATLEFLNLIHSLRPLMPMLCVVDCDPHGIDIMRMYKHGSRGLGHEVKARVPGLHWLGIKMDDILRGANQPRPGEGSFQGSNSQASQTAATRSSQESTQEMNGPRGSGKELRRTGHTVSCNESKPGTDEAAASQPSTQPRRQGQRTAPDSLIALTIYDRKTARRIFKTMAEEGGEGDELDQEDLEQLRELQVMLMLNMKAEIQAIDNMGDLSSWLDKKMNTT